MILKQITFMKKWFIYYTIILATACTSALTKTNPVALSVIPAPQEIQYLNGTFTLNEKTSLQIPTEWSTLENLLNSNIQAVAHYKLTNRNSDKNSIQLKIDTARNIHPRRLPTSYIAQRCPDHGKNRNRTILRVTNLATNTE